MKKQKKSETSYEITDLAKEPTIFLEQFGDTPRNRVLDWIITSQSFDYNMTDLARCSGVAYVTTKKLMQWLLEQKILKFTRMIGKAKMYTADMSNPTMKMFDKFMRNLDSIGFEEFEKYINLQKAAVKVRA